MKFSISYPIHGTTKSIEVDDDNKCRVFFQKRMGQQVEADNLGEELKGYVFKINGGFDKDGFAMKQGIFTNGRIRLLLAPGASGYRAKRTGQRKRRSVRGCIVGNDIKTLSVTIVKKGEKQIPGLTDTVKSRRLGPKRASNIRKLYGLEKQEGENASITSALIKKNIIRRTFKSKKNQGAPLRNKAPKIQRLVTDVRLRRKRIQKDTKVKRWKKTIAATAEYAKLIDGIVAKRKSDARAQRKNSKAAQTAAKVQKKAEIKGATGVKATVAKTKAQKKPETKAVTGAQVKATITKTKKVEKK